MKLWSESLVTGVAGYALTTLPCVFGILFGVDFVIPFHGRVDSPRPDLLTACTRYDAKHYAGIVDSGYSYDAGRRSNVAFFPAYPLSARVLQACTGWPTIVALLVVANLALAAAFVVLAAYLRVHWPDATLSDRAVVLGLFGLCPAGLFFRMPYSESPFLLVALLVLYGMARRWPIVVLALLAGLATAIRPVGVAVSVAVAWYILSDPSRGNLQRRLFSALVWMPVACWGLLAYMAYQSVEFGTPFAFAQTQEFWTHAAPTHRDLDRKVLSLAIGEPIWSAYVPGTPRHWAVTDSHENGGGARRPRHSPEVADRPGSRSGTRVAGDSVCHAGL